MKIYVVYGQTGEYSDHRDWLVCAYFDKNKAEKHANAAAEEALSIIKRDGRYGEKELTERALELDHNMKIDYTGTDYCILEVDVLDGLEP